VAEVVTGEAVVLDVPCARFPSRLLALLIDVIIQLLLLFLLYVIAYLATLGHGDASTAAAALSVLVLVVVGYPVLWETLTRGASPGKFALGLRVVSDDGGPERFRQALVRGLSAVVEIWLLFGCPALICSLLSARGKRLGDLFAGTFVVQHRIPTRKHTAPMPAVSPELARWSASLELSGLTEQTAEMAQRYLARLRELTPAARAELGQRIAGTVSAQVSPPPPPGTPAPEYLSAVLTERRNREYARQMPPPQARPAPAGPAPAGWTSAGPVPPRPGGVPPQAGGVPGRPAPGPAAWTPGSGAAEQVGTPHDSQPPRTAGGFAPPA
jgi:uncharacterized RDD family membrane protein YckC